MPVASEHARGVSIRGTSGYGFTESVPGAPGPHHRIPASFALAGRPTRWLGLALVLDGHGDFHPDDGRGRDRGFVGRGSLEVRATPRVGRHGALGVVAAVRSAGAASPSTVLRASSFDVSFVASHRFGLFTLAGALGYRIDQSARAIPQGAVYRPGDRLALAYSSFDAILARIGVDYRRERFEAFGAFSADLLVGSSRPSTRTSPMRVSTGARWHVRDDVQLELGAVVSLSARPSAPALDVFVPVDPRVTILAGFAYTFDEHVDGASVEEDSNEPEPIGDDDRTVVGVVLDPDGEPLVDAHVVVRVGDVTREGYTDGEGRVSIDGVPFGAGTIRIESTGHAAVERPLGRDSTELASGPLRMVRGEPGGALRGVVRDFEARAVQATIRVAPIGLETTTDSEGAFVLDLPGGSFHVSIEAAGFTTQEHDVVLRVGEVTILNVDLREEP